jgi:hypothetical protein
MSPSRPCRCGCGQMVSGKRVFVNKEHQLDWMEAGGAAEMGALGGRVTFESGQLAGRGLKGAQRAREISERWRAGGDPPGSSS